MEMQTLSELLTPQNIDPLFMRQFNGNEKQQIDMIKKSPINLIVRIAKHYSQFEIFCQDVKLHSYWAKLWCAYGNILAGPQQLPSFLFFSQPNSNNFNLVRGAYFFHLSVQIAKEKKVLFSFSEREYLTMAINYGSIHATLRYNLFLYQALNETEQKDSIYLEIIENSRKMVKEYGSFAYMMLAEGLGGYACWLQEQQRDGKKHYDEALQALNRAEEILPQSKYSIQNASLGQGLKASNRLELDSPVAAIEQLQNAFLYHQKSLSSQPKTS